MTEDVFQARADYSANRLDQIRERVRAGTEKIDLSGLTIFTAGSFARLEAGEHSDVDLFFTYHPSGTKISDRRTNELRLFGRLIDIVDELGFPKFSNDAQYLVTHNVDDIIRDLGGPADDANNYFTLRMLLLLESKCIYGESEYDGALREIISSYFRDYPRHEKDFQPWFLINDIMRYWKTLLLNYENKRTAHTRPDLSDITVATANTSASARDVEAIESVRINQKVKNFKLRFSRLTTCFATVAALASSKAPMSIDLIFGICKLTPQERLRSVIDNVPSAGPKVEAVLNRYAWFLEQTSLPTPELQALFSSSESRREMFDKAEDYGTTFYDLLVEINAQRRPGEADLMRYLVL